MPILLRARALQGLVALREAPAGCLGAGDFARKLGYTIRHGARLRRYLAARGLVTVEEGYESKIPFIRLRLTARGRAVADLAAAIRDADARARLGQRTR
ncbi:MAG: hypothetical protein QOE90_3419 [Thermoplasmata archaeon]|nr:hypothetical protein [Thermoplasmata archaeon]